MTSLASSQPVMRETLLHEIEMSLCQIQSAVLRCSLPDIYANTGRLQSAYGALKKSQTQSTDAGKPRANATKLEVQIHLAGLLSAAVLRRAIRTNRILELGLANFAGTYVLSPSLRR